MKALYSVIPPQKQQQQVPIITKEPPKPGETRDWFKDLAKQIRYEFIAAQEGRKFVAKLNIILEEKFGFTPFNTVFCEGMASDELNEPECVQMQNYWGSRFKYGGLAGYCHTGLSGLVMASHHIPDKDTTKTQNMILFGGPHIGYSMEKGWGKVMRPNSKVLSASCGPLVNVLSKKIDVLRKDYEDKLDNQQARVEQLMQQFLLHQNSDKVNPNKSPIVAATKHLSAINTVHLQTNIEQLLKTGSNKKLCKVAMVTGITINTLRDNYFWPDRCVIYQLDKNTGKILSEQFRV